MSWREAFQASCSPYFACFKAGKAGASLEEVERRAAECGIILRRKDYQNYENGLAHHVAPVQDLQQMLQINPFGIQPIRKREMFPKWEDLEENPLPYGSTWHNWFPCDRANRPMGPWGIKPGKARRLYTYEEAKALSPIGYVGRNMFLQHSIVVDIDTYHQDGVDIETWRFGNQFRDMTLTLTNPNKPGSFHLIFETNKLIPTRHYNFAKLDLLGNKNNQSEMLKDKVSNGVLPVDLTSEIYMEIMRYVHERKQKTIACV